MDRQDGFLKLLWKDEKGTTRARFVRTSEALEVQRFFAEHVATADASRGGAPPPQLTGPDAPRGTGEAEFEQSRARAPRRETGYVDAVGVRRTLTQADLEAEQANRGLVGEDGVFRKFFERQGFTLDTEFYPVETITRGAVMRPLLRRETEGKGGQDSARTEYLVLMPSRDADDCRWGILTADMIVDVPLARGWPIHEREFVAAGDFEAFARREGLVDQRAIHHELRTWQRWSQREGEFSYIGCPPPPSIRARRAVEREQSLVGGERSGTEFPDPREARESQQVREFANYLRARGFVPADVRVELTQISDELSDARLFTRRERDGFEEEHLLWGIGKCGRPAWCSVQPRVEAGRPLWTVGRAFGFDDLRLREGLSGRRWEREREAAPSWAPPKETGPGFPSGAVDGPPRQGASGMASGAKQELGDLSATNRVGGAENFRGAPHLGVEGEVPMEQEANRESHEPGGDKDQNRAAKPRAAGKGATKPSSKEAAPRPIPIEVVGYVKEQPRARVAKGRDVAEIFLNCERGEVKIGGQLVDPKKHQWHKVTLWGIDAVDAPAAFPRGAKVRACGKHHIQIWGDKGERSTSEIKATAKKDGIPFGLEVLDRPRVVPTAFDGKGHVIWQPELKVAQKTGDHYVRVHFKTDAGEREVAVLWDEAARVAARRLEAGTRVRVQGERVEMSRTDGKAFFEIQRAGLEVLPPREKKKELGKGEPEKEPGV